MQVKPLSLLALLLLSACGVKNSNSTLHELATPGSDQGPNELIWGDSTRLFVGLCPAGKEARKQLCPVTQSASVEQVSQQVLLGLSREKAELVLQSAQELERLRNSHPKVIEKRSALGKINTVITQQNQKISVATIERDGAADQKQQTEIRLADKQGALKAVQDRITTSGSTPDLEALRVRLQQEYDDWNTTFTLQSQELLSLETRLAHLKESLLQEQRRLTQLENDLQFMLGTLTVSSDLTVALDAKLGRLDLQTQDLPALIALIQMDGVIFRELELNSLRQDTVLRLLRELKQRGMLPFREDFSITPALGSVWSFYSSRPQNVNQVNQGRWRMESNDGGINEAVLTLPLAGLSRLNLKFFQIDINDNETLLPERFEGHSTGDGVSISKDGNIWYTIVNAFSLNTPEGKTWNIDLDQKLEDIRRNYDPNFGLSSPFFIKFQQYEAAPRPDTREWDDIELIQRPVSASNVRLSSTNVLEVQYNEEWRDVCDDDFDRLDGEVACRMLGGTYQSHSSATGSGNFWLDDLTCKGQEQSLFECTHRAVGTHNCNRSESIQLSCDF